MGSQGRNTRQETEAVMLPDGSDTSRSVLSWFSYKAQDYLHRDGATHSGLLSHASTSNQSTPADQPDLSNSLVKVSLPYDYSMCQANKAKDNMAGPNRAVLA